MRDEKIRPGFQRAVMAVDRAPVSIPFVRAERKQQITHADGIRRALPHVKRRSVSDPPQLVRSVRDIVRHLREDAFHAVIVDGLIDPAGEVVQPHEAFVPLRAVRHDAVQVVRFGQRRHLVQAVHHLVRA